MTGMIRPIPMTGTPAAKTWACALALLGAAVAFTTLVTGAGVNAPMPAGLHSFTVNWRFLPAATGDNDLRTPSLGPTMADDYVEALLRILASQREPSPTGQLPLGPG